MSADQDIIDAVTARLTGHDPREWDKPERTFGRFVTPGLYWYVMRKDSHLEYFATAWEAQHFYRTGVRL